MNRSATQLIAREHQGDAVQAGTTCGGARRSAWLTLLFPALVLAGCSPVKQANICQVLANPKQFAGQELRLEIEASFDSGQALVSDATCQNMCAFWTLPPETSTSGNEKSLIEAVVHKQRSTPSGIASGDLVVTAAIRPVGDNFVGLVVTKVHRFKMRKSEDFPKIVCGTDMTKSSPVGDCAVDAAGCPE
jgi:hypothetical protein